MFVKYLIDENLPTSILEWKGEDFIHSKTLGQSCNDGYLWNYAKENDLVILTKDADFSNRILVSQPPPKVIHYKIGNLRAKPLALLITKTWYEVVNMLPMAKLINVYYNGENTFLEAIGQ